MNTDFRFAAMSGKNYEAPPPPVPTRLKYKAKRNDKCPCGSGKKFNACCINRREPVA